MPTKTKRTKRRTSFWCRNCHAFLLISRSGRQVVLVAPIFSPAYTTLHYIDPAPYRSRSVPHVMSLKRPHNSSLPIFVFVFCLYLVDGLIAAAPSQLRRPICREQQHSQSRRISLGSSRQQIGHRRARTRHHGAHAKHTASLPAAAAGPRG